MKKITLIIILLLLQGCIGKYFSDSHFLRPTPANLGSPNPDAPPEYLQGWNDGCETGLSTMMQSYYKSFYSYKKDITMVDNPLYYQAWKDSYTYCRQYGFRYAWDPFDRTRGSGPLPMPSQLCVLCPDEFGR